tara:strand:- start:805 stop:1533 length:729 start_codon:yes stop_codon:yes gene_type:complete
MNYLTTYYKNLCEQLESQLNNLQKNLEEAYVLNPSQIASAPMSLSGNQFRSRDQIRGRGTQRANALGAMMSAHSYDGVNAHERDAIARIIADTQGSAPERGTWEYQSFNAYRPGARAAGSQATGEHLKIALGAMRRLQNDPRFAEHHTSTVAAQLPDAAIQSAADEDMYGKDPMGLSTRAQNYIEKKATRSATGLSPSTSVSDITQQFGANYGSGRDTSPNEYSDYMPIDMVTKKSRNFKPQ